MSQLGLLLVLLLLLECRPLSAEWAAVANWTEADSSSSAVVELTDASFERLTQASTGATTGDWLLEFYAPSANQPTACQPVASHTGLAAAAADTHYTCLRCCPSLSRLIAGAAIASSSHRRQPHSSPAARPHGALSNGTDAWTDRASDWSTARR